MKKNNILYFFLLFPFFKPDYYIGISNTSINLVYNFWQVLANIIIIILYLQEFKKKGISKIIKAIFVYNIIFIFSTILNDSSMLLTCVISSIKMLSLCMLIDYGIKNDCKSLLTCITALLSILVFINLVTIFMYPHGMWISPNTGYWQNWFLGYDNNHIVILLPLLIFSYVCSIYKKGKLSLLFYFILLIVNITILKTWSATSVVGVGLFDIFILFRSKLSKLSALFHLFKYYLILFFSIVILRLQNLFSFLIVDILKKDLTFSGRTYIWDYILKLIIQNPLLGYGYQKPLVRYSISMNYPSYHAHNFILEIFYRGGILLFATFSYMIILVTKKIKQYKSNEFSSFFSWVIFIYAVMLLTEFFEPIHYVYLLVFFYNVEYLERGYIK